MQYTLEIKEDPQTGDLYIEFPQEVIEELGWSEQTVLEWQDLQNGSFSIQKVVDKSS